MEEKVEKQTSLIAGIVVAIVALGFFLWRTDLVADQAGPILLFALIAVILYPFRSALIVKRLFIVYGIAFVSWLIRDLGLILLPFVVSFVTAYLLDPLVTKLQQLKIKRSIISLAMVIVAVGISVIVSVFLVPSVFAQANEVVRNVSNLVVNFQATLNSGEFYAKLESMGIPTQNLHEVVQKELVPRLEGISSFILKTLMSILSSTADILAQAVNVVLIPILTFYFLADLPKIKALILKVFRMRLPKGVDDVLKINALVRAYISGQIISGSFVGISATFLFWIFGIPYPFVLGAFCGLLNPIPYAGILASLLLAIITIVVSDFESALYKIIIVAIIVLVLHFIATYFIDPKVTGSKVGVHPVLLILSLFVFGHFFGFLGLIVAVPVTSILVMYADEMIFKPKGITE